MTRDENLVLLIEECSEVIQAATKCLRFGFDRNWPDYGINHEVLAAELGDVLGVSDAIGLNQDIVAGSRKVKLARTEYWKKYAAEHPPASHLKSGT